MTNSAGCTASSTPCHLSIPPPSLSILFLLPSSACLLHLDLNPFEWANLKVLLSTCWSTASWCAPSLRRSRIRMLATSCFHRFHQVCIFCRFLRTVGWHIWQSYSGGVVHACIDACVACDRMSRPCRCVRTYSRYSLLNYVYTCWRRLLILVAILLGALHHGFSYTFSFCFARRILLVDVVSTLIAALGLIIRLIIIKSVLFILTKSTTWDPIWKN
jgi:hypothetical protein